TASVDGPGLVWDIRAPVRGAGRLTGDEVESSWADLVGADAKATYRALRRLAAVPDQAVPLARAKLPAGRRLDPARIAELLGGLDAPRFADREEAETALIEIAERLDPDVWANLRRSPSAEVRRRLAKVWATLDRPSAERTLAARAVELVEWCATPSAK